MKKLLPALLLILVSVVNAQQKVFYFNQTNFQQQIATAQTQNNLSQNVALTIPLLSEGNITFNLNEYLIAQKQLKDAKSFEGVSDDRKSAIKIMVFKDKIEGIFKTPEGYFWIEQTDAVSNKYVVYAVSDQNIAAMKCEVKDDDLFNTSQNRVLSGTSFPIGSQLRTFRFAAAATGELVASYGGNQITARDKILSILNATNLIYEYELAIRFQVVSKTTDLTLIFSNAATDPFTVATIVSGGITYDVASTSASQNGFNAMNTSGTLLYTDYDIGHTFHVYTSTGIGSSGLAGPTPCSNTQKSQAWTQWSTAAAFPTYLGMVVNIFAHEVAHQFNAFHTYNAVGGGSAGSTFCTTGWSNTDAIEPGSGTTLMSYANNCSSPNYTLSGNNKLQYFNTKSLEKINLFLSTTTTCFTSTSTGNTPPVSDAGLDITIPKATPFSLKGAATDANADAMSYTWEQYNVATASDKGALGSSIVVSGGTSAVNSLTAPLFRSEQSSSSTQRIFPKMTYVLNNSNNPADNEGEDLPQVARSMKFRFTVRDNRAGGGGVDSDEMIVTVSANGPLEVTAPNGAETWAAGSAQTVTWAANGTVAEAANVKISLSIDGGVSFPYTLLASTPNDGSQAITIPATMPASTNARIKIAGVVNPNAEFFDVSNANFSITSTCAAFATLMCPTSDITAVQGNASLNFGSVPSYKINSFLTTKAMSITTNITPIIGYTDATTSACMVLSTGYYNGMQKLRVSKTGAYTFSNTSGGYLIMSLHTALTGLTCANFVGSNGYAATPNTAGSITAGSTSMTLTLNECTDYYLFIYNYSTSGTFNISFSGAGDVFEPASITSGFSVVNVAVSNTDNLIKFGSYINDFTTLAPDSYKIYAVSIPTGVFISTYYGQTMAQMMAAACVLPSTNFRNVVVTCSTNPAPPTTTGDSDCGSVAITFYLTAAGCPTYNSYRWYETAAGGVSVANVSYLSPLLSASKTYYVSCANGVCESTRTAVTANYLPALPIPTTASTLSRCGAGTFTLTAANCGTNTYNWLKFDAIGDPVFLSTNASYTTASISANEIYYVYCSNATCDGDPLALNLVINPIPAAPTVTNVNITTAQVVTLNATGCSGTVTWFNAASSNVGTGVSYTTPTTVSATTSYTASCTSAIGCISATRGTGTITFGLPCPPALNHTATITSGLYKVTDTIDSQVSMPTPVTYQAGKSITLKPGFKADNGNLFEAKIATCN
jgi:Metallo-peptidase family M12/Ig-like domain CHU_C associated